jgi:hypothetical protein
LKTILNLGLKKLKSKNLEKIEKNLEEIEKNT